jgi:hypothetical protein
MTTTVLVGLLSFSTAQSSDGDSIRTRSMSLSESALEVEARASGFVVAGGSEGGRDGR